ncbi:Branched-chain-amino-acid aminotransferase [bioreactor metagenome]|uniref:Branched-chain-amino-acid aminotransferase n=1 Tax=bioreactor metagenome TaxID=1076179 RepID=A0A645JD00_9ZZZZ
MIQVAKDLGYEVIETDMSRIEMLTADEVWMTGTAAEVVIVTTIDNRSVGNGKPGKVATELQKKFADVVRGKDDRYASWIEYVN